ISASKALPGVGSLPPQFLTPTARFLPLTNPQTNKISLRLLSINRGFISGSVLSPQVNTTTGRADAPAGLSWKSKPGRQPPKRRGSMKRAKLFAAVIYGTLVLSTMAFVHFPELRADETQARIGAQQAREVALRAVPATDREDDLETRHGRLVYSFEIAPAGYHGTFEIAHPQHGYFAGV